jgi:hypothetical protein
MFDIDLNNLGKYLSLKNPKRFLKDSLKYMNLYSILMLVCISSILFYCKAHRFSDIIYIHSFPNNNHQRKSIYCLVLKNYYFNINCNLKNLCCMFGINPNISYSSDLNQNIPEDMCLHTHFRKGNSQKSIHRIY